MPDFTIYLMFQAYVIQGRFLNIAMQIPNIQTTGWNISQTENEDLVFFLEEKFSPFKVKVTTSNADFNSAPANRRCYIIFTSLITNQPFAPINQVYQKLQYLYGQANPGTLLSYNHTAFPQDPLKSGIIFYQGLSSLQISVITARLIGLLIGLQRDSSGLMALVASGSDADFWSNSIYSKNLLTLKNKLGLNGKTSPYEQETDKPAVKFKSTSISKFKKWTNSWIAENDAKKRHYRVQNLLGLTTSDLDKLIIFEGSSNPGNPGNNILVTRKKLNSLYSQEGRDADYYKLFLNPGNYELSIITSIYSKVRAQIIHKIYEISEEQERATNPGYLDGLSSKCGNISLYPPTKSSFLLNSRLLPRELPWHSF
jgi:hypothetical protein